ncbi:MAG TPA: FAD-dependent oxidoreductase [Sphingomicrobium sp.]|nr:FAD-dependent oxidoreductase [Sphingomicrobium sp.]
MLPVLDRRAFVATGSAAMLSGCATLGARPSARECTAFPPVEVSPSRLIRAVAGLRPYRASGFVVRREQLNDKALVHNYGHGGGGITLSWGSSRLAADLGLAGHSGPAAVIGAGVMGLTTARLVQEAGFSVTIYTAALPPDTLSNIAGGQFFPHRVFERNAATPEFLAQFTRALDYSWKRFQIMVGEEYGIRWLPTFEQARRPEPMLLATFPPVNRMLAPSEHPFPFDSALRYDTLYVETGRYLRQMLRDFRLAGGKIKVRRFASSADIAGLPEPLAFNCTGLGSRELFGDRELRPARGQLAILLPQPEVRYAASGRWGYMFPRSDGILLGGTFELDEWSTTPDPGAIAGILAAHKRIFGALRCTLEDGALHGLKTIGAPTI